MKHILLAVFSTFFLSSIALADSMLYEVTHVDETDSLNMRTASRASAPLVTSLPYHAKQITRLESITRRHSRWSKIKWQGKIGWVNAHYIRPQTQTMTFRCSGTEPFWGISIRADNTIKFRNYDTGDFQAPIRFQKLPSARPVEIGILVTKAISEHHSAIIVTRKQSCSDGMSDINYPYSVTALINDEIVLEGCCE
jgi:uncharacterized membrane protein